MEIFDYILSLEKRAAAAVSEMSCASFAARNAVLSRLADALREGAASVLAANKVDLDAAAENGVAPQMLDRLALNDTRIEGMAASLEALAALPDAIGQEKVWTRESGIEIHERRVPLGVVAIIFEARPNVTLDAAALCIKTGNVAILRGGKEALHTSMAIRDIICDTLESCGLPRDGVLLVERTEREGANALMTIRGYVDVLIPRGGKGLIRNVVENAKVPVIETGAGNCHLFVDKSADIEMAIKKPHYMDIENSLSSGFDIYAAIPNISSLCPIDKWRTQDNYIAAAEKAAARKWRLSDREIALIDELNLKE